MYKGEPDTLLFNTKNKGKSTFVHGHSHVMGEIIAYFQKLRDAGVPLTSPSMTKPILFNSAETVRNKTQCDGLQEELVPGSSTALA